MKVAARKDRRTRIHLSAKVDVAVTDDGDLLSIRLYGNLLLPVKLDGLYAVHPNSAPPLSR